MSTEENPFLAVIRVWAAVAWADDKVVEEEAEAMKRLIAAAPLGDEDKATALGWLRTRVDLDTDFASELDELQRAGVYRAAVRLVRIDRSVAPEETEFLGRLREGLGLDADACAAIEAAIEAAIG